MKEFFNQLERNQVYKTMMKEPLTYVAGAVLLSVLQIAHFTILRSGWGVTSPFINWGAWVYELFGGNTAQYLFFANENAQGILAGGFFSDGGSVRNLGIIFGALIATLFASQFKIKKIKSRKQVMAAVIGGLLMGYGARMALGCNIGALFTAISALSLSGWFFAGFMLIGAWMGSKLLVKYFL